MKNALFVISHLGSGSDDLVRTLNRNSRVMIYEIGGLYNHYSSLQSLFRLQHKTRDASAIYGDHLLYNTTFYCSNLYPHCKFIYVIASPKSAIPLIVEHKKYSPTAACRYYTYRLRRICEMAKRTSGSVLLKSESMKRKMPLVENYLGLKEPLKFVRSENKSKVTLDTDVMSVAEESYERHLYFLSQQDLLF